MCRVTQAADLTAGPVPGVADDSAVVFVSCVLEYVSDPEAALLELQRMAGSAENLFIVCSSIHGVYRGALSGSSMGWRSG